MDVKIHHTTMSCPAVGFHIMADSTYEHYNDDQGRKYNQEEADNILSDYHRAGHMVWVDGRIYINQGEEKEND